MATAMPRVHPTALVHAGARLADDVEIGAYSIIGDGVEIGAGTRIGPHVVVNGPSRIGRDNRIVGQAAIGSDPQDKKFSGEESLLEIGDRNLIREFVTINRGTGHGGGLTRIGNDNWLLSYVHVAHDCRIGNHCVFSNNATLAGHVTIEDHVIMSGFTGAHQFCRIGAHAFIGMGALAGGDVPPFVMLAKEEHGRPRGINIEGLKRRGFSPERISAIKRAYRVLYVSGASLDEARRELATLAVDSDDIRAMLDFLGTGERRLQR
jgi:UDP-N-acetylglucosamine acyltransferase